MTLILSSASPARRALLARLQIPFISTSPDVDETPLANESIPEMVLRLAELKARKSALEYPNAFIIGCDQVGELNNKMLAKPHTHDNAVRQLREMSGQVIRFYTGICLLDANTNHLQSAVEIYDVYFRTIDDETIEHYLQKEKPYQCAGSCQVEGLGITLIERLVGNDYTALIGLPLIQLTSMLEKVGRSIYSFA